MSSSDDDTHDAFCDYVDSCTQQVVSETPYWNMSADQRAEWVRYAKQKRARELAMHRQQDVAIPEVAEAEGSSDEEEDKEEPPTQPEPAAEEAEEHPPKKDKRALWRDYQKIGRHMLKQEGVDKPTLSQTNAKARALYIEDGHMTKN